MSENSPMPRPHYPIVPLLLLAVILAVGGAFRSAGLFRGLDRGVVYHPDSPKQAMMIYNYVHGNHVQYVDSRFYDGYPYGLNRVDEGIVRMAATVLRPLAGWLNPDRDVQWMPDRAFFFAIGRILRVLYGLLTILLIYDAVRRLGGGRSGPALAAALIYAVAPLGITVAHPVTGDIGLDLFLAAAMACLARFAQQGRIHWLAASGLCCGMAFACKYQGAVGAWMTAVATIGAFGFARGGWRAILRAGLVSAAAFVAGVLLLTPAFFIDASRTWKNMRINFAFIRDYGVPKEFLERPLLEKATYGLTHNVPLVLESLGWGWSVLGLACLAVFIRRLACRWNGDAGSRREAAVLTAIGTFAVVAILLSAALKPEVQPFHFSYLLPVLAVMIGAGLAGWTVHAGRVRRCVTWVILFLILAVEVMPITVADHFFWSRPEASFRAVPFADEVFKKDAAVSRRVPSSRSVKVFYNDPSRLAVFRNRPSVVQHNDAAWWLEHRLLPVPSVPLPGRANWIFMNGPVFPKDDRTFHVPGTGPGLGHRIDNEAYPEGAALLQSWDRARGRTFEYLLVFHEPPREFELGLRTGFLPSRYRIEAGGRRIEGLLLPHSQRVMSFDDVAAWEPGPVRRGMPPVYIVRVEMASQLGPLWVTAMNTPEERANFERCGPEGSGMLGENSGVSADEVRARMEGLRYLDGPGRFELDEKEARIKGDAVLLAAGGYTLRMRLFNPSENARLELRMEGEAEYPHGVAPFAAELPGGFPEVSWSFRKGFVPYDPVIFGRATPPVTVLHWELIPDPVERDDDTAPSTADAPDWWPESRWVRYHGLGSITHVTLPETITRGQDFRYLIGFELDERARHRDFHEASFFLHFLNETGEQVAAIGYPLKYAGLRRDLPNWHGERFEHDALPPGRYRVEAGIYNGRTRLRYDPLPNAETEINPRRQRFLAGWVEVR